MGTSKAGRARLWLGGLAFTGVAVGHWVAYRFGATDPHAALELEAAHGYWSVFSALAVAALVAGLGGFAARRLTHEASEVSHASLFRYTAARLALIQTGCFVFMEALERTVAGLPLGELLSEPVIQIGLVAQMVIAIFGALILIGLSKVVDKVRVLLARSVPAVAKGSVQRPRTFEVGFLRLDVSSGGIGLRGPPATV